MTATMWQIKGSGDYQSGAFRTRGEAIFRLRQIATEDTPGNVIVRQSDTLVVYASGDSFRVAKV